MEISEKSIVTDSEINELRAAVNWDITPGIYNRVLKGVHSYFVARDNEKLIGFVSVISDGVAEAFLVDMMVHPDYQRKGLGKELILRAVKYSKSLGVQCVHVTFNKDEEQFYRKCGFHIFSGGVIDFKTMDIET